ncbi:MAG: tetratricopeptide repeat protein [Ignavibacteriae bacterium]|nr:tetratricopeptide repeat protein [Ignavibacteriota bacterium]
MKQNLFFLFSFIVLWGCSPSPEATYKEARTAEEQKNFPLALERYEQIVNDNTETAYAESSQYRIALIYNNELREIEKAARAYRKFSTLFPNSKDAPTCMFLAAFIYNNDMKKPDSAKAIYEEFMQKFPTHELYTSAKFELQTMGKDPGEFLHSDTTTQVAQSEESKTK